MLLMWLGAPKNDAIEKALDYRINGCLLENGAYGVEIKESAVWRPCHSGRMILLPCHGAELLRLMIRYGYVDDPRGRNLCQYGNHKPSPDWFRFGFPLQWTSDIKEVKDKTSAPNQITF